MNRNYRKAFFFFSLLSTSLGKKLLRKKTLEAAIIINADPRPDAIQPKINNNKVWGKEDELSDNISSEEANRLLQSEMSISLDEMNGFLDSGMTMSMNNMNSLSIKTEHSPLVDPVDSISLPGNTLDSDDVKMYFNSEMVLGFPEGLSKPATPNENDMSFLQNQLDTYFDSTMKMQYPSFVQASSSIDLESVEYSMSVGEVSFNMTQTFSFSEGNDTIPTADEILLNENINLASLIMDYLWSHPDQWWYHINYVTIYWDF